MKTKTIISYWSLGSSKVRRDMVTVIFMTPSPMLGMWCCDSIQVSNPWPLACQSSILPLSKSLDVRLGGLTPHIPPAFLESGSFIDKTSDCFLTNPQIRQANPIPHWIQCHTTLSLPALVYVQANTSGTKCITSSSLKAMTSGTSVQCSTTEVKVRTLGSGLQWKDFWAILSDFLWKLKI